MSSKEARDWPDRREDIFERAQRIRDLLADITYAGFLADAKLQDAIHYNLLVIGEAAGKAPLEVQQRLSQVPWNKIKGMRNAVAHGYFALDAEVIWETATLSVPDFVKALEADTPSTT